MISKYLKEIGVKEENLPQYWNPDDKRQTKWQKEREKYGFDERETWSLDYSFYLWAYPRLKMYNEVTIVATESNHWLIEFEGEKYNFQQCIDMVLEGFAIAIRDEIKMATLEEREKWDKAIKIFALILPGLWW